MRLFEAYTKVVLSEFWDLLESDLQIDEAYAYELEDLLYKAKPLVFDKFKIDPQSKDYFIAGSATLYLYPKLRDAFNLKGKIGDLDIIIPNKQSWIDAGLEKEWNEGGIYRPEGNTSIEVFNIWDPSKAGGEYADTNVRSSSQIMADMINYGGYNFMSLKDVMDYKLKLARDKEHDVVDLANKYENSDMMGKTQFLRKIVNIIGLKSAKQFLKSLD